MWSHEFTLPEDAYTQARAFLTIFCMGFEKKGIFIDFN